jgi:hypothetical protein
MFMSPRGPAKAPVQGKRPEYVLRSLGLCNGRQHATGGCAPRWIQPSCGGAWARFGRLAARGSIRCREPMGAAGPSESCGAGVRRSQARCTVPSSVVSRADPVRPARSHVSQPTPGATIAEDSLSSRSSGRGAEGFGPESAPGLAWQAACGAGLESVTLLIGT